MKPLSIDWKKVNAEYRRHQKHKDEKDKEDDSEDSSLDKWTK